MKENNEQLAHLAEIRSMMERSSRFLSLSGLSGISAGLIALAGAFAAYYYMGWEAFSSHEVYESNATRGSKDYTSFLILDGIVVIVLAVLSGFYFTLRKARKKGYKIWSPAAKRLAINILIPLSTGGVFCLILIFKYHLIGLVAPATLIFYGLTLLNASKYTLDEIRYLGISEIILGLIATYYLGYGLLFWAIGFGVLHIVYGALMYNKYER